jgi:cytochrome d ubiquinol oxidase subunit II
VTPLFLGVTLGAVTSGDLRAPGGVPSSGFIRPWFAPFQFAVGLLTLALFAFLAASYLTVETEDEELRRDFQRRALAAQLAVVVSALVAALATGPGASHFTHAARREALWWPLHIALGLIAAGATWALARRRFGLARLLAPAQAALMVAAWGVAQRPFLIAPDVTIESAAAPARTLDLLLGALVVGALLLIPSLFWLYRVFKRRPHAP